MSELEALTEYLISECEVCDGTAPHRLDEIGHRRDAAGILEIDPAVGKLARQLDSARAWAVELEQQVALLSWLHAEALWWLSWSMPVEPPSTETVTVNTDPSRTWRVY